MYDVKDKSITLPPGDNEPKVTFPPVILTITSGKLRSSAHRIKNIQNVRELSWYTGADLHVDKNPFIATLKIRFFALQKHFKVAFALIGFSTVVFNLLRC